MLTRLRDESLSLPSAKDYVKYCNNYNCNDLERATQCLLLDVCLVGATSQHLLQ